jgi:hypothetical protein
MTVVREQTYEQRRARRMMEERAAIKDNPIARAQASLDARLERQRAHEAWERQEQRRLKRELDPFDWGHWGPWD